MKKKHRLNPGDFRYELQGKKLVLGYRKQSLNSQCRHFHMAYEVQLVLSGERQVFVHRETIKMGKGDLLLIPPGTIHKYTGRNKGSEIFWLTYGANPDLMELLGGKAKKIELKLPEFNYIKKLLQRMTEEFVLREKGFEIALQSAVEELLIYILRIPEDLTELVKENRSDVYIKMMKITEYIDKNYQSELTLHSLSEEFYISTSYLSRSFHRETGFSLVEYINLTRVLKAKTELLTSEVSIGDICMHCGFGSFTHFGRIFKSITGQSPGTYRRLNKTERIN